MMEENIYVFHGEGASLCSAVFDDLGKAESWIASHQLSGLLTAYPLNQPVFEWAVDRRLFTPKQPHHNRSSFIGSFTSAYLEHHHYENGQRA